MRELLLEAAKSGDIEKLRPYVGEGDDATMLSSAASKATRSNFSRACRAMARDTKSWPFSRTSSNRASCSSIAGTENDLFVWPYFYGMPLDKLTPAQRVELYRLVTHGDYEDMKSFGAYNFYRVGITPQGRWRFFVAGD